jgi:hypothetical protein
MEKVSQNVGEIVQNAMTAIYATSSETFSSAANFASACKNRLN